MVQGKINVKTVENAVKVACGALVILFFLPVSHIDFFEVKADLSLKNAAAGMTLVGNRVFDGKPVFYAILLLPAAIALVLHFLKKNKLIKYVLSLVLVIIDGVTISKAVDFLNEKTYGFDEKTFWLTLTWIVLILIGLGILLLLYLSRDSMAGDFSEIKTKADKATSVASAVVNEKMSELQKRKCDACGADIPWNAEFCPKCGAKYVEKPVKKCQNCGAVISDDSVFCSKCGTKWEEVIKKGVCPSCGYENKEDALFCEKCGSKLC